RSRATPAKCRSRKRLPAWGEGGTTSTLAPACRGRCGITQRGYAPPDEFPGRSERSEKRVLSGPAKVNPPAGSTLAGEAEMSHRETEHLRVLIANERRDRLALVAPIVAALGHEVIAREIEVEDVGAVTAR